MPRRMETPYIIIVSCPAEVLTHTKSCALCTVHKIIAVICFYALQRMFYVLTAYFIACDQLVCLSFRTSEIAYSFRHNNWRHWLAGVNPT